MNIQIIRWIDIYLGIPLAYLLYFIKKITIPAMPNKKDCQKILIIKFWGIGNLLMLIPSVQALQKNYPKAKIDLLTLPNNKELAVYTGVFSNIYAINHQNLVRFIGDTLRILTLLKNNCYNLIIDFEQFARFSSILCAVIGKEQTIGFKTTKQHRHFLYTDPINYNNNIHITRSFYSLVRRAQCPEKQEFPIVPLFHHRNNYNNSLKNQNIGSNDILITLHTGTSENFKLRRWPAEYYAELADKLIHNFKVKIAFTGLKEEISLVKDTIANMKHKKDTINVCGILSLEHFIAFITSSDLIISADTAPVHLASALCVPVAGLYGPNTPLLYGPWNKRSIWFYKGLHCSPCITNYNAKINKCKHPEGQGACMKKITVDEVFTRIKNTYLDNNAPYNLKKIKNDFN